MITAIERNNSIIYIHTAYATDNHGKDFALNYFNAATYIGTYMDRNNTENSNWQYYTWHLLEDPSAQPIDEGIVVSNGLEDRIANLEASAEENYSDIVTEARNAYEGIGNVNELIGTNQGINGYTAPTGYTITALPVQIFEDPNIIQAVRITCNTPASGSTVQFDAAELLENIEVDNNTYTLSLMIRYSNIVSLPASIAEVGGGNELIDFGDIYIEAVDQDDVLDNEWLFFVSTATMEPATVGSQNLLIDVSNMETGDTIDIVNLKVEKGAIATPWMESLEEINQKAQTAFDKASDAETAAADAAKTATDYILPVEDGQGNITEVIVNTEKAETVAEITKASARLTESSLDIYVDEENVASYGETARIGATTSRRIEMDAPSFKMFDSLGANIFDIGEKSATNIGFNEQGVFDDFTEDTSYSLSYIPETGSTITAWIGQFESADYIWASTLNATFNYGTAGTQSGTFAEAISGEVLNVTINYDGAINFTLTVDQPLLTAGYWFFYQAAEILYPQFSMGLGLQLGGIEPQVVLGKYNVQDALATLVIGGGTGENDKKNLVTIYEPTGNSDMTMRVYGNAMISQLTDNSLLSAATLNNWARIANFEYETGDETTGLLNEIVAFLIPQMVQAKMTSGTTVTATGATQITAISQDISVGSKITFNASNKRFIIGAGVSIVRASYIGTSTPTTSTTQRWLRINTRKNGSNQGSYNQQYMASGATTTFVGSMFISVQEGDYIDFTTQTGTANTVTMNSGFSFSVEAIA